MYDSELQAVGLQAVKHNYCGGSAIYELRAGNYVKVNGQAWRVSQVITNYGSDAAGGLRANTIALRTGEWGSVVATTVWSSSRGPDGRGYRRA